MSEKPSKWHLERSGLIDRDADREVDGKLLQCLLPALDRHCPLFVEGVELALGLVGVWGGVNRLEVSHDLLHLTVGYLTRRIANQVDDAKLDFGLRKDGLNRFRKALQAIHARNQDIFDAAILEIVKHGQPELCAFGFSGPEAQHFFLADHVYADHQVDGPRPRPRGDLRAGAVFDPQGVQIQDRIYLVQSAAMPSPHFAGHHIRD